MKIINIEKSQLAEYVCKQIATLLPLGEDPELKLIDVHLEETLTRLNQCISSVNAWRPGEFDILHSSQYCTFLYFLCNTIWRKEQAKNVCTKIFQLNKALNAIDCFYEIELPNVFFIGHSVGIVLAKATYGERLVLYQNSTVGKNHGVAPILEDDVILYPNSAVIGRSLVRSGTVVSQGVSIINKETLANHVAYQDQLGRLTFRKISHSTTSNFFRN
jgi:serine O-acetyltransferase